jgi:phytol kinase
MDKERAFELRRHAFHMGLGLSFVFLVKAGFANWIFFLALLTAGIGVSYWSTKKNIPIISWFLRTFERQGVWPGKGAIFFTAGTFLVVFLFPQDIALASIMILTFGDSVAHIFGRFFGKIPHPWNNFKLIEGTMMGFFTGAITAAVFVPFTEAFVASAVAMAIESIELKYRKLAVDDNLIVPLVSGIVIWLLRSFVNVPI